MKNIQDVFLSVSDWSKNITGLFFYIKQQLVEYEYTIKIIQSSITTIHRSLKSNLLKLLCDIRKDCFDYQTIDELHRISKIIDSTIARQNNQRKIFSFIRESMKSLNDFSRNQIDGFNENSK